MWYAEGGAEFATEYTGHGRVGCLCGACDDGAVTLAHLEPAVFLCVVCCSAIVRLSWSWIRVGERRGKRQELFFERVEVESKELFCIFLMSAAHMIEPLLLLQSIMYISRHKRIHNIFIHFLMHKTIRAITLYPLSLAFNRRPLFWCEFPHKPNSSIDQRRLGVFRRLKEPPKIREEPPEWRTVHEDLEYRISEAQVARVD